MKSRTSKQSVLVFSARCFSVKVSITSIDGFEDSELLLVYNATPLSKCMYPSSSILYDENNILGVSYSKNIKN